MAPDFEKLTDEIPPAWEPYAARYYDMDGTEISMRRWAELTEDRQYRIVGRDEAGGVMVSTVWLGLNHNFLDESAPLIFETMVFGAVDDETDNPMWRWATLAQARQGHAEIASSYLRPNRRKT